MGSPGKVAAYFYDSHFYAGSKPRGVVQAAWQATVRQGSLGTEAAFCSDLALVAQHAAGDH